MGKNQIEHPWPVGRPASLLWQAEQDGIHALIATALKEFDWRKVERVMHAIDWKWAGIKRPGFLTPTIEEMKEEVRRLMLSAYEEFWNVVRESGEPVFAPNAFPDIVTACGGFEVRFCFRDDKPSFYLSFVVTEWYNEV